MNLIEGSLERADEEAVFNFRGLTVAAGRKGRIALGHAQEQTIPAILGIRPESIHVVSLGTPEARTAQIITLEPLGQMNLIMLKLDDVLLTCLVNPDLPLKEGETVAICLEPESMHFFDPQTGENLLGEER